MEIISYKKNENTGALFIHGEKDYLNQNYKL